MLSTIFSGFKVIKVHKIFIGGILFLSACHNPCYNYTYSHKKLVRYNKQEFDVYDFRPHEVVASIGASSGWFEIASSVFTDSLTFYIQDIERECINVQKVKKLEKFYTRVRRKPMTNRFIPVLGNETQLCLSENTCDKVLLRLSFHEFSHPDDLMQNIKAILKEGGILYITENIAAYTGEPDKGCGYPLWELKSLIAKIESYGFVFLQVYNPHCPGFTEYDPLDTYRVFAFKK
ncbi:MAG: methyltransferase domain-containing protein [Microscillaceae bacterium]|nr:methyltransferase domain-containing protein [Microscillaceae bacterium]